MNQEQKLRLKKKFKEKEMKKIVVITNIREVIEKLLEIMKNHIGEENRISRLNLFKKVFKLNPEQVSELQEWIMWEFIKKAMHRMRQRTKCFIVSKQVRVSRFSRGGIWHYWVAKDLTDYIVYRDNIERNIRAMRRMTQKCDRAIKNQWYKEDWEYK